MFTKSIDKITFEDVENFCQEFGEGVRVEYKRKVVHIPKIVSSFANTLGGIFVIGAETDEMNKVKFPIPGIPKQNGIEEQILQSALTGIYPAVIPEVVIVDMPNSNNIVVVIRVDESIQAPHAIQNSTRVYIRVGSITQPYELTLADTDRIAYMLKRREDSQVVAQQILNRIEERTETLCATDDPNLTVIVRPVFPYQSVISTVDLHEVARAELAPQVADHALRRVSGGTCFLIGGEEPYNCLELNQYGIVYYRAGITWRNPEWDNPRWSGEYVDFPDCIWAIGFAIKEASLLYEKCESLGNLEISAQLRGVFREKLRFHGENPDNFSEKYQSLDSEILASTQCFERDFLERKKVVDIVDSLVSQLLWAFNIDDPAKREELIEINSIFNNW